MVPHYTGIRRQSIDIAGFSYPIDDDQDDNDYQSVCKPVLDVTIPMQSRDRLNHFDQSADKGQPFTNTQERGMRPPCNGQDSERAKRDHMLEFVAGIAWYRWRMWYESHRKGENKGANKRDSNGGPIRSHYNS